MVERYSPITANWNGMIIPEPARLDSFLATVRPRGLLVLGQDAALARHALQVDAKIATAYRHWWPDRQGDNELMKQGVSSAEYAQRAAEAAGDTRLLIAIDNEHAFTHWQPGYPEEVWEIRQDEMKRYVDWLLPGVDKLREMGFRGLLLNSPPGNLTSGDWSGGLKDLLRLLAEQREVLGVHEYQVGGYEGTPAPGWYASNLIGNYRHAFAAAVGQGWPRPLTFVTEIGIAHEPWRGQGLSEQDYAGRLIRWDRDVYGQDREQVIAQAVFCYGGSGEWAGFDMRDQTVFWEIIGAYYRAQQVPAFDFPTVAESQPEPTPTPEPTPEPSPVPDGELEKRLSLAEESLSQLQVRVASLETENTEQRVALRAVLQQWLAML